MRWGVGCRLSAHLMNWLYVSPPPTEIIAFGGARTLYEVEMTDIMSQEVFVVIIIS